MLNNNHIEKLLCIFCITLFFLGCDTKVEPPKKPQLVRKKIIAKKQDAKTPIAKTAKKDAGKRKVAIIPKSDVSSSSDIKKTTPKPPVTSKQVVKKTFEPKSDISKTPADVARKLIASQKKKKAVEKKKIDTKKTITQKTLPGKKATKPVLPKGKTAPKTIASKGTRSLTKISPNTPYNPKGKIDPFQPLFKDKPIVVSRKKRKRRVPRTPLERIALSQLRLVAIIRAPSGNKACVEESSGKGYIIKKGDYIGLNSGKVIQIRKDNIVIEEEIEDNLGELQTRQKEIKLPKPTGE